MIQANVEKDNEAIMARFTNDINHDITHIVELYHHVELEEMMYMTMKMEKQLKRKMYHSTKRTIRNLGNPIKG
jgi:hypothetical protein